MNRVALVTGGSRGIGRGIALELAGTGFDVVVNYAGNEAAARQTAVDGQAAGAAAGHAVRLETCQGDVGNAADRLRLIQFTRERFGRLDVLVNNAGVAPDVRADLLDTSEESFDRLIRINVKGPFFLTQLAARWMMEQVQAQSSGAPGAIGAGGPAGPVYRPKIVTVSSISAYTASVNRGEYCISKAALSMVTPLFAARLAEQGIQVFEIRPGIIATDMTGPVKEKYDRLIAGGLTPIRRWGTPGDVGRAVAMLAGDAMPFSTGDVFNIDGGFHLRTL